MSVLYTYFYAMSMYIYKNRNICANRQIYNEIFKINVHIVSFCVSFPRKSIFRHTKAVNSYSKIHCFVVNIQYISYSLELIFIQSVYKMYQFTSRPSERALSVISL